MLGFTGKLYSGRSLLSKGIQKYARKETVVSRVLSTHSSTARWHEANAGWAYELQYLGEGVYTICIEWLPWQFQDCVVIFW